MADADRTRWTGFGSRSVNAVRPWTVRSSTIEPTELLAIAESSIVEFHRSHPTAVFAADRLLDTIRAIANCPGVRMGTLDDAYRGDANVAIRVDVDVDLLSASLLAEALMRAGLPASFFLLQTAGYAGWNQPTGWERHECVAPVYRQIAAAGEIGLHLDPWGIIDTHRLDGVAAVVDELQWLRSLGIEVHGVSAHNAAPVHGRENFEVFAQWRLDRAAPPHKAVQRLPVGQLDAAQHDLSWCAGRPTASNGPNTDEWLHTTAPGDPLRSETWLWHQLHSNAYCRWRDEVDVWLLGDDRWALSDRARDRWIFDCSSDQVIEALSDRAPAAVDNEVVVLTLHPLYVGWPERPRIPSCLQ